MKTREVEMIVGGAWNQYLVLATVVKNAEGSAFIINHVQNYPLGCTIPHTQIILLFSSTHIHITKKIVRNLANATLKVYRHNHPLHLTPSLEVHQSDSPICRLCVRKVDTLCLYYCSRCDFAAHLYCAILPHNREYINLEELKEEQSTESKSEDPELHQSFDTEICKVKKTTMGEDGTQIATEIKHFSHEHDLKLTDEIPNNTKCNGCIQSILSPFYSCTLCSFFLHKSCSKLPKIKRYTLHPHPLTLSYQQASFCCYACGQTCNGLIYKCQKSGVVYNVQCILLSDTLTHASHEHRLYLSNTNIRQQCSSCNFEEYFVCRCSTCEFVLDFKCATLPQTAWYNQHEHPFNLYYTPEDGSGEYYCEICEEERDPKQWFYYCAECSFPAHRDCILGKNPNVKQHI
ncbi:hypothetical protein CFP56_030534 [Quercus suber]|uniref:DC1 domain-containing protein n=1 Tax=Quercus suber TaxID=58331 RepID=A0AAW0JMA9_QUESU